MQPPDLSRRTVIAVGAIVAGVVVIAVALLGGSGSSENPAAASGPGKSIEPVEPLDPDDKDAGKPKKNDVDDLTDPFASNFGTRAKHKVTVRATGNGSVNIGVHYRDRKKPKAVYANGFQETRTITTRYPLAAITIQIPGTAPGAATIATCTIVIDNVEVSRKTTRKPWAVEGCIG